MTEGAKRSFDGTRRVRAWPHPIAPRGAVRLVLERARVDGREVPVDDEQARVELGERFAIAQIEGRVEVEASTIAALLPADEHASPPLELALVWRCEPTRVRRALRVALSEPRFELELRRDDVDDVVSLVAQLVRTTEGLRAEGARGPATAPSGDGAIDKRLRAEGARGPATPPSGDGAIDKRTSRRHARGVGAWVGASAEWTLALRAEPPRDGRFLEVQYQRFSEDASLRELGPVLYRLELDDEPVLWLNADHARAAAVLSERGTRGVRARLRETIYDRIACGVWTQLFIHAVEARHHEVRAPWHDAVLDALLPEVFRGVSRAELRSRLDAFLDYDGIPGLLGLLDVALQRRDAVADHVVKLVAEALPDVAAEAARSNEKAGA